MTDVASAIEQLRVRFYARAAADMVALRRWSKDPAAHKSDLHLLVHRLAGAAGTFGFHRLSEIAAKAEDAILTDAPDRLVAVANLIDELARVGDQVSLDGASRRT